MYLRVLRIEIGSFFGIFGVLAILWVAECSKMAFLLNFYLKKPSLNTQRPIKWLKHQISQKNFLFLFEVHSNKKIGQFDHFPKT